ncbi:[Pyruvate dehydrogenase [acetyl-transferring]]-phosphatase 1, mitochondrial [Coemansia sp. RSA 455]|nr:[Pyruvate dehydrogenase [acetyl-transferring]]-phosphatase 1, mitochondrial [Coemansia sp. S680]KAJ2054516.1 [Pyruvate dehydrogenase [acetyl-transferring]]-phosphatase 1, mitochondrial [Coemansia sp. S2]KAJ2106583.1 [Pyruvate dehydrogenase [acetyl-transferring]]-phosphatase 1, mitochondrial [Coemansia sp. S142-1]KAJ2256399.1 [Pyruvate dehydrogenase [acetyl-transferring]]-phosphatase 1, mitochondrial [Coemansia sp. RSA 455]KAJ2432326.1 [Pyruvate dehydrogenase [acetyl-transferring]]-phosphatas
MQEARSRRAFGTSTAASQQPSNDSGASGKKTGTSDTPQPAGATKRSLTFAIGGILALLGVTSYTLLRQPSGVPVEVATQAKPTPSSTQTALESVATKRSDALKKLDNLTKKERREEAQRLGLLTEEEVNAVLHAKENSWFIEPVAGGSRLRVDTNQVSSNDPIEDYLAWTTLSSNATNRHMFSVFDGHAGYMCAEQLAARMGPMLDKSLEVIAQLADLKKGVKKPEFEADDKALVKTIRQIEREAGLNWDHVPLALTATFINMDYELVTGALAEFRKQQQLMRMDELLGPSVSGSCGLVAVVDTEAKEVVVANTGDSRALLGVRLKNGTWKAVRLSQDQTADNANELARMAREHPGEDSVIHRGRVLGGLMPTRAFGDCRYKWPLEAQQDLFPILYSRGHRYATTPPNYVTPPYVTARPVIVKHMLSDDDKFIVIASDGLYDQLSDAEVIGSVSQWYEAHNQKGASTLTTEDDNAATHLIRAALSTDQSGRRSDTYIRRLLAIPPPHSRRFRDDISVTIVTLNAK